MKKKIATTLCLVLLSAQAYAFPVNAIAKFFKGLFSHADDVTKVGKNVGESIGKKADDVEKIFAKSANGKGGQSTADELYKIVQADEMNNLGNINNLSSKINLQKLHTTSSKKLGKFHEVENVTDFIEFDDVKEKDQFWPYILTRWIGHALRIANKNYNNSQHSNSSTKIKDDDRMVLQCTNQHSVFTFTIDQVTPNDKIAYLSYHVAKNQNYPLLVKKQRLHVLGDTKEYLLLSVKKEPNKNFPTHYFVIFSDMRFKVFYFRHGTESPGLIKLKLKRNYPEEKNNRCYRNFAKVGTVSNNNVKKNYR